MKFLRLFQAEPPSILLGGRYKVLQQLGAGGFGQTFLAEDLHLPGQPHCVVKRLQPQFSDPVALQTAKRLFDTEAQTLYALGSHDQIPKLLAHFEQEHEFYLVQELIVGHSLTSEVRDGHSWSEAQVVGLLRDILNVLAFVHQQNVIHRDIKPANLIRRHADGKIVLIDFGAVKQATTKLLQTASCSVQTIAIGTPGYMPNEQLAGSPRFSSDVYAVGMIAIHALTGISPQALPQDSQTSEILWQTQATAVHPELAALLNQMVCYDFRVRFPTAAAALAAIDRLPIAPEPPLMRLPHEASGDTSNTTLPPSIAGTTLLTPENQRQSPTAGKPLTVPLSQHATLPLIPDPAPVSQPRLGQNIQVQPRSLGLGIAGIAGAVLVVAMFKPLLEPRPASDPAPAVNASAPAASSPTPAAPAVPSETAVLLAQADQQRSQNQFQQAIQSYDQAIALDANLSQAHWGRCYSLNRLKQFDNAVAACDRALKLNPSYAEALWSKGYALERQEQNQAALRLYEQAIAQKPDFAKAWNNKGTALIRLDRPAEAVAAFDRAIAIDSSMAEAWSNRGAALWSLRRFEEALASVEQAIQVQPDYADAIGLRQQMQQRLGGGGSNGDDGDD